MSLDCLPRPRHVKQAKGRFTITRGSPIVLSPSCDQADRRAAAILREEAEARASIELAVEKHARVDGIGKSIVLLRLADAAAGFPAVAGAGHAGRIGNEGYLIEVSAERVVVAANASAGIYYGVQTLRQILDAAPGKASFPGVRITDWPDFRYRGLMHDISRGKVPTLKTLFGLVDLLGSLKMNCLQLYTEHAFGFRRHPEIGRGCGPLTHEDVMRLDEYARRHHVELQANLQSFGHMKHILSIPRYRDLAESDRRWTIAPGHAETYAFLGDLYDEHLPCFTSPVLNAGCDETFDLGEGKSKARVEKLGLGRVYLDHVKELRALAGSHGKRLAIWADVALAHPEVVSGLPGDVILLNWGYGAKHDFASTRRLARGGRECWVCPGTNAWNALFPRIEQATANIAGFAKEGLKSKASGLLVTDWGDGGHPNLLGQSFHGIAFSAEAAWTGPARDSADFDGRFSWALVRDRSGILGKIFRALGVAGGGDANASVTFDMYWAEFPYAKVLVEGDAKVLGRCERMAYKARKLLSLARQVMPAQKLLLDELDLGARQMILAFAKARVAAHILAAVPREPGDAAAGFGGRALPPTLTVEVSDLLREWRIQRDEFERLWMARSRRSEIEQRLRLYRDREQELARLAMPESRGPFAPDLP